MHWSDSEPYQQLVAEYPKLAEGEQKSAFTRYLDDLWAPPQTYPELLQAYIEFTTPKAPQFRKLAAMQAQKKSSRRRSKRRRGGRRRRKKSRRKKKR